MVPAKSAQKSNFSQYVKRLKRGFGTPPEEPAEHALEVLPVLHARHDGVGPEDPAPYPDDDNGHVTALEHEVDDVDDGEDPVGETRRSPPHRARS